MATLRHRLIGAGFAAFRATQLHRALAPWTRGRGAVLAFHHVRPLIDRPFAPNRLLEITPGHLDAVLGHVKARGYEVVPLATVPERLAAVPTRPFLALTFDDGYRDNVLHALPVLERHGAPFTVFVTTGFADRTAPLWWLELEDAVARRAVLQVPHGDGVLTLSARSLAEKRRAFERLARLFRGLPSEAMGRGLAALGCAPAAARDRVAALCLGWDELALLADHPLATVGCHTVSHPNLSVLAPGDLARELSDSRCEIEARLGRPVTTLAYPYGSKLAAGQREFAAAAAAGVTAAVTTRPGVLWPEHATRPTALPRLSVNGLWPDIGSFDVLLSGAPFGLARPR